MANHSSSSEDRRRKARAVYHGMLNLPDREFWGEVVNLLSGTPFGWDVWVESGPLLYITVRFDNGTPPPDRTHKNDHRWYITGDANPTYTIDYYPSTWHLENGQPSKYGGDTGLPRTCRDPFVVALKVAAEIARMEHD